MKLSIVGCGVLQFKQLAVTQFFAVPSFQFAVIATQGKGFVQISLHTAVAGIVNDGERLSRRGDEMIERLANRLAGRQEMIGAARDVADARASRCRRDSARHAPSGKST